MSPWRGLVAGILTAAALVAAPWHASATVTPPTVSYSAAGKAYTATVTGSSDTVTVGLTSGAPAKLTFAAGSGTPLVDTSAAALCVAAVDHVECDYTNLPGVVVNGGTGNDVLRIAAHLSSSATLNGGAGNDVLSGDKEPDSFVGGAGFDTVDYSNRIVGVSVILDAANGGEPGENDSLTGIEGVVGGNGNDTIVGNAGDNTLSGGPGNDTISGAAGNDVIHGDDGTDDLRGDAGDDSIYGDAGSDLISGGDGTDALFGGADSDTIDPGAGSGDFVSGGDGIDTATYATRTASVLLSLDGQSNDGEIGEGDDISTDVENLTGGQGNDTLVGNAAVNRLDCGPGSDTVTANAGDTVLNCEIRTGPPSPPTPTPTVPAGPTPLGATVAARFRPSRDGRTRVARLDALSLPSGATVTLTCSARHQGACPFKRKSYVATGTLHLVAAFKKRALPTGTVVRVTMSAPGTTIRTVTYTMRRKHQPRTVLGELV